MAHVKVVYLPTGEDGKKQGADDFLAAGHSIDDIVALATTELREPPQEEKDKAPSIPYRETPHGLFLEKQTEDGPVPVPLANFTARITADVVEDDGVEERRLFEVEARLQRSRLAFDVPGERFATMNWVLEHMGASAIVLPGSGTKDHVRAAIQFLSGDIKTKRVYTHTGWRKIDDEWDYLHAEGAIGPEGPIPGVEVSLGEGRMEDYLLPAPSEGETLQRAVSTSLRFLELAPKTVTVPLLAATFRTVLGEAVAVDLSLHVAGPTGTQKTELTAMALAHFGTGFNGRNLPANWSNTANALEKQAFIAKDAPLVIDDFAPTGTTYDVARLHREADRLLRAQGNRSGRGRMNADGSLRRTYHPRGLIISSGEDTPKGQSLRARMLILEVSPGDVDLKVLTELQRAAAEGVLAAAMSGFASWLAPRMDGLKESLPARWRELRTSTTGAGFHARTPDTVASLALGFETFFEFAVEVGAVSEADAAELQDEVWRALGEAAKAQSEHQAGEEPTRQFLDLLTAAIVGGDAHVASAKTDEEFDDANVCVRWGWRARIVGFDDNKRTEWHPQGRRVGWLDTDGGSVLLEPGAAFATAQQTAHRQGTSLPVGQRTLWKRMAEKGLLASRDSSRGRNITRATIAGERRTVVHLVPGIPSPEGDPIGPNDPSGAEKDGSGPKRGAAPPPDGSKTAHENGPDTPSKGAIGPEGPIPEDEGPGDAKVDAPLPPPACLPEGEVHLIDTEAGLRELASEVRDASFVALDLETTGLDPRRDRTRLLTLATEQDTWVVDCFEVNPRPLFPILAGKRLAIHNATFDLGFLRQMGFEPGKGFEVIDTIALSQLTDYAPEHKEKQ